MSVFLILDAFSQADLIASLLTYCAAMVSASYSSDQETTLSEIAKIPIKKNTIVKLVNLICVKLWNNVTKIIDTVIKQNT